MTLGQAQRKFTRMVADLIVFAYAQGYELSFGETYRTPEQAAMNARKGTGIAESLHTKRLAVDFNLFRNGQWLSLSEQHRPLGEYWKSLDPANRWGGDFKTRPDGNHYSYSWGGLA